MIRTSRPAALIAVLSAALLAGCAGPAATDSAPTASPALPSDQAVSPPGQRPSAPPSELSDTPMPSMPAAFPVHPAMEGRPPEAGDIASWTTGAPPSEIYDFYVAQLPTAGFVIDLAGPGGEVAVIRFHSPDGTAFQLDLKAYAGRPVEVDLGPPHP